MKRNILKEKLLNCGKSIINPLNNLKVYFQEAEILYKKEQKLKKKNSCLNLLKNEKNNLFNNKSLLNNNSLNKSDYLINNLMILILKNLMFLKKFKKLKIM